MRVNPARLWISWIFAGVGNETNFFQRGGRNCKIEAFLDHLLWNLDVNYDKNLGTYSTIFYLHAPLYNTLPLILSIFTNNILYFKSSIYVRFTSTVNSRSLVQKFAVICSEVQYKSPAMFGQMIVNWRYIFLYC